MSSTVATGLAAAKTTLRPPMVPVATIGPATVVPLLMVSDNGLAALNTKLMSVAATRATSPVAVSGRRLSMTAPISTSWPRPVAVLPVVVIAAPLLTATPVARLAAPASWNAGLESAAPAKKLALVMSSEPATSDPTLTAALSPLNSTPSGLSRKTRTLASDVSAPLIVDRPPLRSRFRTEMLVVAPVAPPAINAARSSAKFTVESGPMLKPVLLLFHWMTVKLSRRLMASVGLLFGPVSVNTGSLAAAATLPSPDVAMSSRLARWSGSAWAWAALAAARLLISAVDAISAWRSAGERAWVAVEG